MPGEVRPGNPRLDSVCDVIIDDSGRFKYILCKIYDADCSTDYKYIVRGDLQAEFHSDIYDDLDAQMEDYGLICECVGGGTIFHEPDQGCIEVLGHSQSYGPANHQITVQLLKQVYASYPTIIWSDD